MADVKETNRLLAQLSAVSDQKEEDAYRLWAMAGAEDAALAYEIVALIRKLDAEDSIASKAVALFAQLKLNDMHMRVGKELIEQGYIK